MSHLSTDRVFREGPIPKYRNSLENFYIRRANECSIYIAEFKSYSIICKKKKIMRIKVHVRFADTRVHQVND